MASTVAAAVIGSGNIGTDLLLKLMRSERIDAVAMVGVDPESSGLARARELGVEATAAGVDAILERDDIQLVFDATSARAHMDHGPRLEQAGKRIVDLTPAARGPYAVPAVNLDAHLDAPDVNMVTCGGQATVPFVHAIASVAPVAYAEIVATISSRSAGPGTRQNIDEFTVTTARALESVGGARSGKAIVVLNPADPPILMRDTVFADVGPEADAAAIRRSVQRMADELAGYVPGCRLTLCEVEDGTVTVMVEIEGAGDFLPPYAGNLDIMTAAATRVGERIAERMLEVAL